jgi:hypothetical protein
MKHLSTKEYLKTWFGTENGDLLIQCHVAGAGTSMLVMSTSSEDIF